MTVSEASLQSGKAGPVLPGAGGGSLASPERLLISHPEVHGIGRGGRREDYRRQFLNTSTHVSRIVHPPETAGFKNDIPHSISAIRTAWVEAPSRTITAMAAGRDCSLHEEFSESIVLNG